MGTKYGARREVPPPRFARFPPIAVRLRYEEIAPNEKYYGPDHPNVAIRLNNLAQLLADTNRLAEAEPLMRRALAIFTASLGPDHQSTQTVARNLAALLAAMGAAP